jgi:hypothetical protein
VHDLALQVGEIDVVVIAQGDVPHTAGGEVQSDRRAEPAGADHQRMRGEELLLAPLTQLREQDMAAVAQQLLVAQIDFWFGAAHENAGSQIIWRG